MRARIAATTAALAALLTLTASPASAIGLEHMRFRKRVWLNLSGGGRATQGYLQNRKKGVLMSKGFLRPISKAGRMRIRRRSPLLAGLVALFTVFSIAPGGTPAWASTTTASYTYTYYDCLHAPYKSVSSDGGAVACFFPNGEWFGTCDSRSDGHHAEGLYERPGNDVIIVVNTGYGTCAWFNDDLVEGTTVYIRAANCEGSSVISWGPRITAKA